MNEITKNNSTYLPEGVEIKENNKDGERMFSQSELEDIISERLSRERKKNESLSSVKELLKSVAEKGLIKSSSYAEMAKELACKLKEKDSGNSEGTGKQDSTLQDEKTLAKENDASSVADGERKNDAACEDVISGGKEVETDIPDNFMSVFCDVKNKYGKDDMEKLFSGDLFERFARGRTGNTREVIDEFLYFVNTLKQDDGMEEQAYHRNLASTAFSGDSSGTSADVTLTRQQMDMAKSAGMSYREYAHLLGTVPVKNGRSF